MSGSNIVAEKTWRYARIATGRWARLHVGLFLCLLNHYVDRHVKRRGQTLEQLYVAITFAGIELQTPAHPESCGGIRAMP